MRPLGRVLLALLAGLAVALGFAPYDLWWLALAGCAGLVGLVDSAPNRRSAAGMGWLWGFAMFAASLTWIATAFTYQAAMPAWMGWVTVLALSAFLALYPMLAALTARMLRRPGMARLLMLSAAFMVTELVRGTLLSGFAWNPLGAAWLGATGVGQLAEFIGATGTSGLMMLAGGGLWMVVRPGSVLAGRLVGLVMVLAMLVGGAVGNSRIQDVYFPDNPELIIVQPNIGQGEKYDDGGNRRHVETYLALTAQAIASVTEGAQLAGMAPISGAAAPATSFAADAAAGDSAAAATEDRFGRADTRARRNLVIWSESAVFGLPEEDPALRARLASVLRPQDLLIFGGLAVKRAADGSIALLYNSLFVLDAKGALLARYDKSHLTPLGEYVPARELMERLGLARLAPGDIDFVPGPGPRTLIVPGMPPVGAMICYEIIFGGRVVEPGKRPAWIVNISNDAWFGPTGPPQHLAQARLRAIEEGLPIARATPTGVSALIGPRGRVLASQPLGSSGFIRATLPPPLPATLYARFGDLMPLGFAAVLALAGLWMAGGRQRRAAGAMI